MYLYQRGLHDGALVAVVLCGALALIAWPRDCRGDSHRSTAAPYGWELPRALPASDVRIDDGSPRVDTSGRWSAHIHGASMHSKRRDDGSSYNARNVGIGLERELSESFAIAAGAYRNSIDRTSVYALARWTPIDIGSWRLGGVAGLVTGYEANNGGPTPAAALAIVSPELWRARIQVIGLPSGIHPKVVGFVGVSILIRLGSTE